MSCIGGSSSGNKRKGKEIAVDPPEEKRQLRKGKEIAPPPEESSDDGYEPDWDPDSDPDPDSDSDSKDEPQGKKKKKKTTNINNKPAWLDTLVRTRFWDPCEEHGHKNRADQCMFCLKCYDVTCPRCTHKHRRLKIRRYVYRSVVHASDMQDQGLDVSKIQTYVINARKVLHLRPMTRSKQFRPQAGTPRCITCRTWLRSTPNLYCSLVCEGNYDVHQDDYSGPKAELRYRSFQVNNMVQPSEAAEERSGSEADEHEMPAQVDEPPPPPSPLPANASLRKRARKQAKPERAPFF